MNVKDLWTKENNRKLVVVVICCVVALLSVFVVAKFATSPECYKKTIESIDDKKATVMGVTTAAAVASTALASVVGDATTPIANEIMDISSYLLIVVCALVLEKSLLTVFGFLAFKILIPIACAIFAVSMFWNPNVLRVLAYKFVVFGFVLAVIIPFSLKISDLIYEANTSTVEDLQEEVSSIDRVEQGTESEDEGWWSNLVEKVEEGANLVVEKAKQLLNHFIDTIALFVITYCVIPIVVFLTVIWFVEFLFKIKVPLSLKMKRSSQNELSEEKV